MTTPLNSMLRRQRVTSRLWSALLFLSVLAVHSSVFAANEQCDVAVTHLRNNSLIEARSAATQCYTEYPDNVSNWWVTAQVEAREGNYTRAETLTRRALTRYPNDTDWLVFHARIAWWQGNVELAHFRFIATPDPQTLDDEALLLGAQIFKALGHDEELIGVLGVYLQRNPGDADALETRMQAQERVSPLPPTDEELQSLCKTSALSTQCTEYQRRQEDQSHYRLRVHPNYMVIEQGPNAWGLQAVASYRIRNRVYVVGSWDQFVRTYERKIYDTLLGIGLEREPRKGWLWSAGFQGAIWTDYSPKWTLSGSLGYRFKSGLEPRVRYRRLQFIDAGVHVLNPSILGYLGPFVVDLRYYLGIHDITGAGHLGLVRVLLPIGRWSLYGGLGGGNQADYLQPIVTAQIERTTLGLAGIAWKPSWRHRVGLNYVRRSEQISPRRFQSHQFIVDFVLAF